MKRTLFSLIAAAITLPAFARWTTSGTSIYNANAGNVGIGVTSPADKLHVVGNGGVTISNNGFYGLRLYNLADNSQKMHLYWRPTGDVIEMNTGGGSTRQISFATNGTKLARQQQIVRSQQEQIEQIKIKAIGNGNVGIGTPTPDQKLSVNGTTHSRKVLVDLNGWSDYVFKPEYKLRTLNEVKKIIEQNQHLPCVPSEKELEKTGIDVNEMLKLQMKKIEELTLYLIEQRNEINALKKDVKSLTSGVSIP